MPPRVGCALLAVTALGFAASCGAVALGEAVDPEWTLPLRWVGGLIFAALGVFVWRVVRRYPSTD